MRLLFSLLVSLLGLGASTMSQQSMKADLSGHNLRAFPDKFQPLPEETLCRPYFLRTKDPLSDIERLIVILDKPRGTGVVSVKSLKGVQEEGRTVPVIEVIQSQAGSPSFVLRISPQDRAAAQACLVDVKF